MFNIPDARLCDYTVRCKGCGENIPAPVLTMPDSWVVADCALCGARRSYLPSDIFRGRLSFRLFQRRAKPESQVRPWGR